jgi:DNA-binding CsgD family transcriptional regulator
MRTLVAEAARIARAISTSPDPREMWTQVKTFALEHGFRELAVLRRGVDLPPSVGSTVLYGDALQSIVVTHDDFVNALVSLAPFSLGEARARNLRDAANAGADGWIIPVLTPLARGVVIVTGPKPDMSPLLSSVLHLLSILAFARVEEHITGVSSNRQGLTAREIECLRWVARGKTDREIAEILSVSPRTARFHVENVKTKLNVETRVHAVAEAIRRQLIAA